MKSCAFFGHRYVSEEIENTLVAVLTKLIENKVSVFYVGSQGDFDSIVIKTLKSLKEKYPHIRLITHLSHSTPKHLNSHILNLQYPSATIG